MNNLQNENKILITNIQRFSLHDGPGIRTTVFLKGCSLRCPWCCNPENLTADIQAGFENGEEKIYGEYVTGDELYGLIAKDRAYYTGELSDYAITTADDLERLPGGITFSGGEALLQINALKDLLGRLKDEHIHTAVETCLFIPSELLEEALKYIDLFYVDIKILDRRSCQDILSGSLDQYLRNLDILFSYRDESDRPKPVVFRLPVIAGYTDGEANKRAVIDLINKYRPIKVELIKGHDLGRSKYMSLNMEPPRFVEVSDTFLTEYSDQIKRSGIAAEVCTIQSS